MNNNDNNEHNDNNANANSTSNANASNNANNNANANSNANTNTNANSNRRPNAPVRRPQIQGFLNMAKTEIRSPGHVHALIGLLQLANAHPDGIVAVLGYTHKKAWIIANLD